MNIKQGTLADVFCQDSLWVQPPAIILGSQIKERARASERERERERERGGKGEGEGNGEWERERVSEPQ